MVDHFKLGFELTEKDIPIDIIYFLMHYMRNVVWNDATSEYSLIKRGVRQGGILSPFLFKFYIDSIIDDISLMKEGCIFGITKMDILAYADDLVLLSSSLPDVEKLYQKLCSNINRHNLQINNLKKRCIIFRNRRRAVNINGGKVILEEDALEIVDSYKYLRHVTEKNVSDTRDIELRLSKFYATSNSVLRNFIQTNIDTLVFFI